MAKKTSKLKSGKPTNGDDINWEEIEKEFRHLHREVADPDKKRMAELQKLAKEHDRELVISGSQAWLVELEWNEPEEVERGDA
jgi:hypothetical protein